MVHYISFEKLQSIILYYYQLLSNYASMNLLVNCFNYPYRQYTYPPYTDTEKLAVSTVFVDYPEYANYSRKLFNTIKTPTDAMPTIQVSTKDQTFDEALYNNFTQNNFDLTNYTRNISASIFFIDGNFSTSKFKMLSCKGIFITAAQKGYADCIQDLFGFGGGKFEGNETLLTQQAMSGDDWPNDIQYSVNFSNQLRAESGEIGLGDCKTQLFYSLSTVTRPNSSVYEYAFDTQSRKEFRKVDYKLDANNNQLIPKISFHVISNDCGFQFNQTSIAGTGAASQKNGLIYFAVLIFLQMVHTICSAAFTIQTNTATRLNHLSLVSLTLHMNSEYLVCMLFMTGGNLTYGLTNLHAFMVFFAVVALFPLIMRTVLLIMTRIDRRLSMFNILCRVTGLTFLTIGFAILTLILAYIVDLVVIFVIVLVLCCYLFVNSIIKFVQFDEHPGFPIYFVLSNFASKAVILLYIFAFDNAYGIEFDALNAVPIGVVLGVQLVVYFLQKWLGPRFGFKKPVNKKLHDFNQPIGVQQAQKLLLKKSGDVLLTFKTDQNPQSQQIASQICANPLHKHSLKSDNINSLKPFFPYVDEIPVQLNTNFDLATYCFGFISQKELDDFTCPICFDQLDLKRQKSLMGSRIFTKFNQKLFEFETQKLQGTAENVWVTKCGHCFHEECFSKWAEENIVCPVCRGQTK